MRVETQHYNLQKEIVGLNQIIQLGTCSMRHDSHDNWLYKQTACYTHYGHTRSKVNYFRVCAPLNV